MPLSVARLISGMTTLVATTPNLIVNSELIRHLKEHGQVDPTGFHFFSFTPFGVPVLILGIIYMLFARRWLTSRTDPRDQGSHRPWWRLDRGISTCNQGTPGSHYRSIADDREDRG